jgi:uncharacterized membrane protein YvbJ
MNSLLEAKMKRFAMVLAIAVISPVFISGCAKMAIEKTISEFEDAVNNEDQKKLKDVMSPDSDFYVTATFQEFLDYFDDFRDVNYKNLDIEVDGRDAEVYSDATYNSGNTRVTVLFWMRREEALFAFLFPDFKVYRYYDNLGDFSVPIWQKLKEKPVYVE